MADFTCEIKGLDQLEAMLRELAPQAAKTAIRRAVKGGIKIVQDAIEQNAPRDTGTLADNINIGSRAGAGDGEDTTGSVTAIAGPAKHEFYGLFQEFGTKNQPAQPFMTPAYEDNKENVVETFIDRLSEELGKLRK